MMMQGLANFKFINPLHFLGAVRASNIHKPQRQILTLLVTGNEMGKECHQIMKLCRLETFLLEKQCPAIWLAKPYY
jgi:hypothetical protein